MKSYEVLKKAVTTVGAKAVAADMNLSTSLIYKWCETNDQPDDGGADNPLDRVLKIYEMTGDTGPIEWLCEKTEGYRVDNPETLEDQQQPVLRSTQTILRRFTEVLEAISESYANGNRIDLQEAARIRKEWEELKRAAETFVAACEHGVYNRSDA